VNVFSPKVRLTVYINKDQVEVSLDSSGEPLFKRGYRVESVQAPLNEVLAAGLIAMSGWNNDKILIDPMCGSGTILAEAALKAQNLPSNILRKDYAFQRWNDYEPELWTRTVKSIMDTAKRIKPLIQGADISGQSLKATASNLKRLGLENIKLDQVSFFDSSNTHTQGIIITNPPYDERLELDNAMAFYKEIGNSLKQNFTGFEAWILSGNTDAIKHIGLATSKKIKLVNGAIESTFNKYSLYSGSRKMKSND
jgi:putative N6-adenine-specific DNA methylase